uniref:Large ribosomal subunit protein mL42 n=1 Tax=Clastoptera arizonana TaxID=38151 RepID=A0A1B6DVY7_9HEMI
MALQYRLCSSVKIKLFQVIPLSNKLFKYNISSSQIVGTPKSIVSEDRVVITDDGSTIVCWHPEKSFPYECSKPLPETPTVEHSVLKVQNSADIYEVFKSTKKEEVQAELMKITHTTKHKWVHPPKRFLKKKPFVTPREGL